jgi:hypothetical protein
MRITYTVFFEVFGKKMQTKVEASNIEEATKIVLSKIKFHRVQPEESSLAKAFEEMLKGVFK